MPVDQPFNVYREQLTSIYHGLALWNPNPVEGLYECVSIGDVGYLCERGFIRMFNVTLRWDDPSNTKFGPPNEFESLDKGFLDKVCRSEFDQVEYTSPQVSKVKNEDNCQAWTPDDVKGQTYKCKARGLGALLSLPHGGHREDVIRTKAFEDYIRDHVVSWFTWAQDNKLGVDRMEDLILVTGCTLVTSWAAAAFDDRAMPVDTTSISLNAQKFDRGGAQFFWDNNRGNVEYHNSRFNPNDVTPLPQNQSVCIRGFRAKRTFFGIKHLRAGAEPLPDDHDNHQEDDEIQVTRVPGVSKYRDPLIGVLDYIVERCLEDAIAEDTIAIAHDDDLQLIEVEPLTADAVEKFLREKQSPLFVENGAATLRGPLEEQDIEHIFLSDVSLAHIQSQKGKGTTIEKLPRETLDIIFRFYGLDTKALSGRRLWEWYRLRHVCQNRLMHVCRRWRSIILDLIHRLGLQLLCTNGTPVRNILHSWPKLPIVMRYGVFTGPNPLATRDVDEIIAALQQPDRIRVIQLTVTIPLSEKLAEIMQRSKLAAIMQDQYPVLEHLELTTQTKDGVILHDQFLGGAAPRLHTLRTNNIALPGLPRLLSSAINLVSLQLEAIPSTGFIPPDDLIATLSALTRLQMFYLHFLPPTSLPDSEETLQPLRRVTLPTLKYFEFHGDFEYLECLSDRINGPIIKYIYLTLLPNLDYSIDKLREFIGRTETPSFGVEATVHHSATDISITFSQPDSPRCLVFRIPSTRFDWQMDFVTQICVQLQPSVTSAVRQLVIYAAESPPLPDLLPDEYDDMDHTLFLDFFRVFGGVESLRVTKEIGSHVAHALVGSSVLPVMQDFYVEEHDEFASVQTAVAPFIAARRRSDHPVSLHPWEPINFSTGQPRTGSTHIPASFIQRNDPTMALEKDIRQTCERFSPRSFAIYSLHQRAQSLLLSFMRSRRAKDLENSIEVARDLLEMHPRQMRRVKLLRMLAFCHALGSHELGHRNISVSMFEDAFQDESATTSERLDIAWWWATFARAWDHPSTSLAYRNTLTALHGALTGAFAVQWNPSTDLLGSKIRIPLEYASYQIESGQLERAVETIEHGKMLVWSEIYDLRTSAGRLCTVNTDLAGRLATVGQDLAAVNASILAHRAAGSQLEEEEDHERVGAFSPMFMEKQRLLLERQEIVSGIKALPGFENFMEDVHFHVLQDAASRGPIIVINHCRWRCDILIVLHDSPPSLITTTEGFYERAIILASTLLEAGRNYAVESELYQQGLRSILKELYERVGQPVLDRLRELGIAEQSRIWWYPTSVFCSLPLHAMGPVPSTDGRERYFSDVYVCSYTPTLGSLIAARTPATPTSDQGHNLLFVGQSKESPRVMKDLNVIGSIGFPVTRLVSGNATRAAVINGLQKHRLAHFACRSHREEGKPFDTALELDGGDRIALLDMVRCQVPTTELVVLSSGRTAELVDGTDFVEGLHFTAAMQYYGFGSVVGAMWDLGDVGGEDLSLGFYRELLLGGAKDISPSERSARALQYTVQKLREKGVPLQRWANWVHYGA